MLTLAPASFSPQFSLFPSRGAAFDLQGAWRPAVPRPAERADRPISENTFNAVLRRLGYADIRSVVETARRRAIGALDAIRLTLAGKPLALP